MPKRSQNFIKCLKWTEYMDKESSPRKKTCPLGSEGRADPGGFIISLLEKNRHWEQVVRSLYSSLEIILCLFHLIIKSGHNLCLWFFMLFLFCFVLCIYLLFHLMFLVIPSLFYFTKISIKNGLGKEKNLHFSTHTLKSTVLDWRYFFPPQQSITNLQSSH